MILEVNNLTKSYPAKSGELVAVNNISFSAAEGEVLGILGPNGSGKTTTLKSIAGLTSFNSGKILIDGIDNQKYREYVLFRLGAVLEGARNIYWRLTALENILYYAGIKGVDRDHAIKKADHLIKVFLLNEFRNTEVRKLSKGMQQKVAIACAMIHQPSLLLLDEPTLGLDVEIVRSMKPWLRQIAEENRCCMIITSHDLAFMEEICDRVLILHKGEILSEDSVAELRKKYSPKKTITISLSGKTDEQTILKLSQAGDWQAEYEDGVTRLSIRNDDLSFLYKTFSILENTSYELIDLKVVQDTLEDIFIDIIKSGNQL